MINRNPTVLVSLKLLLTSIADGFSTFLPSRITKPEALDEAPVRQSARSRVTRCDLNEYLLDVSDSFSCSKVELIRA